MSLNQFVNSIQQIIRKPHVNTVRGIVRHLIWQLRKIFNRYPFEQRVSNSRIIAQHKRCGVSALIYSQGMYDYNNMNLLKELLHQEGGVFFDVGAHIGVYTLIASEQAKAEVFAFEPHPKTFQYLRENVVLNERRNVHLFNVAVGEHTGEVRFTDDPGSSVNHIVSDVSSDTILVPCIRLDQFCTEKKIAPQFLKIDVEGYEYEVLLGLGSYLRQVEVLLLEWRDVYSRAGGLQDFLRAAGLQGPFTADYTIRCLFRTLVASTSYEDRIFCSRQGFDYLLALGFTFPE